MRFNTHKHEHFFSFLNTHKNFLKGKSFLLFLDYDGTLTPIAPVPEKAILDPLTRQAIAFLSQDSRCKVTIVSGRALANIRKAVGLKKVVYVGNHGFEAVGPGIFFESDCFPQVRKIFQQVISRIDARLSHVPGVIVEDKKMTLSVHYRLVDEKKQAGVEKILKNIVRPFIESREIKAFKGKKVYELRPPVAWDKGTMVSWLIKEYAKDPRSKEALIIYIGDDKTDEDAFSALASKAVTICVGDPQESKASYYVHDPQEVGKILQMILSFLRRS